VAATGKRLRQHHPVTVNARIATIDSPVAGKKRMKEKHEKLQTVTCNEACAQCAVGNHHFCANRMRCECTHERQIPKGWRARLRETFPALSGPSRRNDS